MSLDKWIVKGKVGASASSEEAIVAQSEENTNKDDQTSSPAEKRPCLEHADPPSSNLSKSIPVKAPINPVLEPICQIPVQKLGSRTLLFQSHWIQKHPWISPTPVGVLCKICSEVFDNGNCRLDMNWDKAFVSTGYTNWKHALDNFYRHAASKSHVFAVAHKAHTSVSTPSTIAQPIQTNWLSRNGHSICIRSVDEDLNPKEDFVGLYAMISTTGESIAKMIKDVLCRLQLPLEILRGQTYDGAANMSGEYKGAQAIIRNEQPLALYVHCGAHASHLASSSVANCSPLVCNSFDAVHQLGVLLNTSGKVKATLKDISSASNAPSTAIKPLCPTRWLARVAPVATTLSRYGEVLAALDQVKKTNPTASGLIERLRQGNIVLGMFMAMKMFTPLENLNKSLQGKRQTVSGAREAVKHVVKAMGDLRSDRTFEELCKEVEKFIQKKDLDPITLPKKRQPPKKLTGDAEPFHHENAYDQFKVQFFEMIDTAISQLDSRFSQPGMEKYSELEQVLLEDGSDISVLADYPEIDTRLLKVQLPMFRAQRSLSNLADAVDALRGMKREVRKLFGEVEKLVKLLLTVPASSCEAERSFSALRRLKTYLRNTIGQKRLNSLAVCHVHKSFLDSLDLKEILKQFV